ncbi:G protein-regulated inducer of neurite outgrowth 1 [Plectropomus leopardus]|uniref:G protein-regulated inducer of neurite outgrowth 1 n=1 Tax=Plectropomus leopardus TaxID=160734 RepID=UPI001C4A83A1|nr:G protein-regulated inducer of neurite outgrowth 1 [Plectropomus leopardus]
MGSLKDEMRGLKGDHEPCEETDDGERPGSSGGTAESEGPQINKSQESTTQEDDQPKHHTNTSHAEERDETARSKDQALSGGACVKDSTQTDAISLTKQPEDDEKHNTTVSNELPSDGDGKIQGETSQDKTTGYNKDKDTDIESISVPVPATPNPSDPRTPAPAGQQHMHTQVSLEVVQCHSAATSPMTPPEGQSFFFPSSFGKIGLVGGGTKDAELQVGQQVEFCSVATSPMTPKTPSTTAFPELIGRETVQKVEKVKQSEVQRESGQQQESLSATKSLEKTEISGALKCAATKEPSEDFGSNASHESSISCPAVGLIVSQVTQEDSNQQCKQQRMGSMDQDITILVTHYANTEEEEEQRAESSFTIEPEMVKIDEYEELGDVKSEDGEENISTEIPDVQDTSNKTEESSVSAYDEPKTDVISDNSKKEDESAELRDVTKPPVPESPAPFGCHNIRTQVSLEVVQCQSAATSPMTPPEGDQAFYFPSSLGRCEGVGTETKDAELQVGQQVEFRSVATAPMTPRTPTVTTFPDIKKDASIEEKIVEEEEEEEEDKKEQVVEDKEEEKATKEKKEEAAEEDTKEAMNCKEKCEEPVQEVSWDEKGMTWEVYGAVVEVAVLGSAIQKHLEKQVKKQKPSMPPPPPLNPSAMPLSSDTIQGGSGSGSGKSRTGKRGDGEVSRRRRNPFRQLMENMQQPHCCSKAHTAE